jgi:putative RecB family exonuclease
VSLPVPSSLSPSRVSSFKDCALAFRFSAIERLPEPPSPWASKGTLVHAALEGLFAEVPPAERSVDAGMAQLDRAWDHLRGTPDFVDLGLDGTAQVALVDEAAGLVRNYFRLEDPRSVRAIGLELKLEARLGRLRLRGVIDRLDLDDDGRLVVTDYKTGRAPGQAYENGRLGGVHFYAFLCEQLFGQRPVRVQLLHLAEPVAICSVPTEQSVRGFQGRTAAIWAAVERACAREDFRPRPSALCGYCAFKAWCPAFGGDPALAGTERVAVPAG